MTPGQRLRHPIDEDLVLEQRVDPSEGGISELVCVGQEHFHEAALPIRSPHHGASGEAAGPARVHRVSSLLGTALTQDRPREARAVATSGLAG